MLNEYDRLYKIMCEKRDNYLMLKYEYENVGLGVSNSEKVNTSLNPDKFTNLLCKKIKAEKDYKKALQKLLEHKKRICVILDKFDDELLKKIIELRYLNLLTFEKIAQTLNISIQWCCKLNKDALKMFDKMANY